MREIKAVGEINCLAATQPILNQMNIYAYAGYYMSSTIGLLIIRFCADRFRWSNATDGMDTLSFNNI